MPASHVGVDALLLECFGYFSIKICLYSARALTAINHLLLAISQAFIEEWRLVPSARSLDKMQMPRRDGNCKV